jgi:uncharacterized membrane protein
LNNTTKPTNTTNPANGTAKSNDDVARALRETLRGATKGLTAFRDSVARSGMPEALADYRKLQSVLVNQRMWASRLGRKELDPDFTALAKVVGEIHATMAAYEQTFRPLKSLHLLRHDQTLSPLTQPDSTGASTAQSGRPAVDAVGPSSPQPASRPAVLPAEQHAAASVAAVVEPKRDAPSLTPAPTTTHASAARSAPELPKHPEHQQSRASSNPPEVPSSAVRQDTRDTPKTVVAHLDPQLTRVIEVLASKGEVTLDALRRVAKLTKARAESIVAELESAGIVTRGKSKTPNRAELSQSRMPSKKPTGKRGGAIAAGRSRGKGKSAKGPSSGVSRSSISAAPREDDSARSVRLSAAGLGRFLQTTTHDLSRSVPIAPQ